jgi:hypothetical protein
MSVQGRKNVGSGHALNRHFLNQSFRLKHPFHRSIFVDEEQKIQHLKRLCYLFNNIQNGYFI